MNVRIPMLSENSGFVDRMSKGWGTRDRLPTVASGLIESTALHRRRLSDALPGLTIAVSAGGQMLRNDDEYFPFRADSDFLWLTGCAAPNAVVVLRPRMGGHDSVLYLPAPVVAGDSGYLTERERSELWVGGSPSLAEWSTALGIEVLPLSQLSLVGNVDHGGRAAASSAMGAAVRDSRVGQVISHLRLVKDPWEIAELGRAVDATVSGFEAVARELRTAVEAGGERWLQGTFDRMARTLGNGPGYRSIVAAGSNAPVLHWTRNDGAIRDGQLLLLDAGVETRAFYTADVTRTFPVSGTYTPEQRMVHDAVQRAQEAGIAAANPRATFGDFHRASMEVIAQSLHDWDMLPVSVDEALSDQGQHHRRYIVCGVGHHLGLDVHDCSKLDHDHYHGAILQPGMVLTVEPGLYFHRNDFTVPPELRGIGVRIEDDLVLTTDGSTNLSEALPRSAVGLEDWVRSMR